jgi:hypothetical protein
VGVFGRGAEHDGPAASGELEAGAEGGGVGGVGVLGWREDAVGFGGFVEQFGAEPGTFQFPEGGADQGLDAEHRHRVSGEGRWGGGGGVGSEDWEDDEHAGAVGWALGELDGGGGDGCAGESGLFERGTAAGVGGEVEPEGGAVGVEGFDEADRDVIGSWFGGLELAVGAGFAEGELGEAFGVGGGLEGSALGVGDDGVPGEGLEFGLAGEGGLDEVVELGAGEGALDGVEGGDGVEDLDGAEEGDAEALHLLPGEVGRGVGGFASFPVAEVEEEAEGEGDSGDQDGEDPEPRFGGAAGRRVHWG